MSPNGNPRQAAELTRCGLSPLLLRLAGSGRLTGRCIGWAARCEGGEFFSATARDILASRFGVTIGAYSYGGCFAPGAFPAGVTVGRYVSVASGVRVFVRNHPFERLSMHPFFYNASLGFVERDTIESGSLVVGHDAWLGERAIILPGCSRIGIGAVVGAGAVVTKDVPDFAIVAGNPARILRKRFDDGVVAAILQSRWWERTAEECRAVLPEMTRPLGQETSAHPLLRQVPTVATMAQSANA